MNHLNGKSVAELKTILKDMNMVNNITSLSKDQTITSIRAIEAYKNNKQTDYKVFNFGDRIVNINDEQHKIVVTDIPQNIRIIAAAGSGKTSTLICRIKYLIDSGIDPETIMVTTFNVDAAGTIKQRLFELFGFLPKVEIGTFDGISCKLYYKYFRTNYKVSVNEYSSYLYNYLQTENNIVSNIYKYIFFDEFQDISETQFKILKHFYDKGGYLTVIGDDAQNIYQFRGSDVRYILNLDLVIKNLKTYKLVNNYRSTPEIINFANASIINNTEQIAKQMIPNHQSINKLPIIKHFLKTSDQNKYILEQILEMNKRGINFDEIAILSRNNRGLKELEEAIEKQNCSKDVFENRVSKIKYVALISDQNSETKPNIKSGHITMTTIHKSKGLEWQIVFLIDANDKSFPSNVDKTSIQEERRLFYVAVTRSKKELFIYFSGAKQSSKLTRFVQELDKSLYNFVNYETVFYDMDNDRKLKKITAVTEIIQSITEKDMALFRKNEIIPTNDYIITKLHDPHKINKFINGYYLHADFGEFIDRFITRSIGAQKPTSGGLRDINAGTISLNVFETKETQFCETYKNNFCWNLHRITNTTPKQYYLKLMNEPVYGVSIKKIEPDQNTELQNIITKILLICATNGINVSEMARTYNFEVSAPSSFKIMMSKSIQIYQDKTKSSKSILEHIYNVSLCKTIVCDKRRRLMYRNVSKFFTEDYDTLFDDIENKYITLLNPKNVNLKCNPFICNEKLDIIGEPDLVDFDNNKIIDFKCSQTEGFKVEWILQLLAYYSIMKVNTPNTIIKFLEIYNPLKGEIYSLDISNWNLHNEYLKMLFEIRNKQNERTKENSDNKRFPIDFNGHEQSDPVKQNIENFTKIIETDKMKIYDMKVFGDDYYVHLDFLNANKRLLKYKNIIQNFNEKNNTRYIVLDTETTGLPQQVSVTYPHYTDIKKYDDARMIQLCWAVYNNNKLESIRDFYVKPNNWIINNTHIHNITNEDCQKNGYNIKDIFSILDKDLDTVDHIVGHNILFDKNIILSEAHRQSLSELVNKLNIKKWLCTIEKSLPLKINGNFARCKLINLYKFLFDREFDGQHNAKFDVLATGEIFKELIKRNLVTF